MKRKTILSIALLLYASGVFSQVYVDYEETSRPKGYDTIYVNNGTSYLVFNDDVYAFGTSDDGSDFTGIAYKNSLQIRSVSRSERLRSVFVTFGDSTYRQYYYAYLKYDPSAFREYYDFRDEVHKRVMSRERMRSSEKIEREEQENLFVSELKTRSGVIRNMPDEVFDLAKSENGMEAHLRLIRTDNNYAYLKVLIKNTTAVDYVFDKISFQYVQRFRMGVFKKKKERFVEVFPIVVNGPKRVEGYSEHHVVYIIPTFGIRRKEELRITFREREGGRNVELNVSNKEIMSSALIEERRAK